MAIRIMKATTNGQRGMSYVDGAQLTAKRPTVKSLLRRGSKVTGRANCGITIRHRGGGTRSFLRTVDFNGTEKMGIPGKIVAIEYDPRRTAYLALVVFVDGDKRYQLAHKNAKVGDTVVTDLKPKVKEGNRMQILNIPIGYPLFNVELIAGKGGQAARSAGQSAKLVSLEATMAQVQFNSGEIRYIPKTNFATIGVVSNEEHSQEKLGKAGRVRHMGRRPQVRGKVMNPCDHPHGGGEGRNSIGLKYPKTPWGAHALGVKTRSNKRTDRSIALSRHRAKKLAKSS